MEPLILFVHIGFAADKKGGKHDKATVERSDTSSGTSCEPKSFSLPPELLEFKIWAWTIKVGPPAVPFYPGSPTKMDYSTKATLILTFLLEALDKVFGLFPTNPLRKCVAATERVILLVS